MNNLNAGLLRFIEDRSHSCLLQFPSKGGQFAPVPLWRAGGGFVTSRSASRHRYAEANSKSLTCTKQRFNFKHVGRDG